MTKLVYQCRLSQDGFRDVAWIEARGAKIGALVEVPDLGGLWRVETVDPMPITAAWLVQKQRIDRRGMPDI